MPRQLEFDPSYAREVVDVPVADELSESFLAYSLSVITSTGHPRRAGWPQTGATPDPLVDAANGDPSRHTVP